MNDTLPASPLFDGLAQWTLRQGLHETTVSHLVRGFGRRLVSGGIPVSRISIGGMVLHPVFGADDIVWEADHDQVAVSRVARAVLTAPEFQNAPFFHMASNAIPFYRQSLEEAEPEPNYPLFDRLRAMGITDYFAFFQSYGNTEELLWADLPPGMAGVLGAFSTRRAGGFADLEIGYLKAMSVPLALAIKAATTYDLSKALLDTYLGKYSGGHVLDGLVERGDGRLIDCVLWYCDLRDSTRLADETPLDEYLATLNDYFDCTAGAVLDHGGEVLKFIGDAVMAIFPVEEGSRPAPDMCRAALMTAKDAIARAQRLNGCGPARACRTSNSASRCMWDRSCTAMWAPTGGSISPSSARPPTKSRASTACRKNCERRSSLPPPSAKRIPANWWRWAPTKLKASTAAWRRSRRRSWRRRRNRSAPPVLKPASYVWMTISRSSPRVPLNDTLLIGVDRFVIHRAFRAVLAVAALTESGEDIR